LAVQHGLAQPRPYQIQWFGFDNLANRMTPLAGPNSATLPGAVNSARPGAYFAAEISRPESRPKVTAYLRVTPGNPEVVGIDRTW
jgi:hypothetical protein